MEKSESFRCITYIYSEKALIAGTEENSIFCFDIEDIEKKADSKEQTQSLEQSKNKKSKLVRFKSDSSSDKEEKLSFVDSDDDS